MASLLKQAESAAVNLLSDAISEHNTTSRYCCGGRVATSLNNRAAWEGPEGLESDSVHCASPLDLNSYVLRFDDPAEKGISRQILFPTNAENLEAAWKHLLKALQPSDRLRLLSPKQFSIDFDPARSGLLDMVAQILLPGFECDALKDRPEHRGVAASAPMLLVVPASAEKIWISFNHAQSPPDTLGKLLVHLPTPHKATSQASTIFDWSNVENADATLQWAAVRTPCRVAVHPIQDGPQIILLYNLVVSERIGGLLLCTLSPSKALFTNPSYHPLYDSIKTLLESPGFMKEGGRLGHYCRHSYSHSKPNTKNTMPYALQGIDMVLYSILQSLGLKPEVRPLFDSVIIEALYSGPFGDFQGAGDFYKFEKDEYERNHLSFAELMGLDPEEAKNSGKYPDFLSREEWKEKKENTSRVGKNFHALNFCETGGVEYSDFYYEQTTAENEHEWPWKEYYDVKWLNQPAEGTEELALVNNPFLDPDTELPRTREDFHDWRLLEKHYSHLVIIAQVPKMVNRVLLEA